MTIGFSTRIAMALAVILSVGLGVTGILSIQTFERTLGEFLSTRFQFVVDDVRQRIETQLDLGLELSDMQNVPLIMDAYLRDDSQILTIEVFEETGTVVHSTDTSFVGDVVTEDWMQAWNESGDRNNWFLFQRDAGVVGSLIRDSFDRDVGSVALRYSRDYLDDTVRVHRSVLLGAGIVNVVIILFLALFGSLQVLRRPLRDLRDLNDSVRRMAARKFGADVDDGDSRLYDELPEYGDFARSVQEAQDLISEATAEVRRIDEEQAGRA